MTINPKLTAIARKLDVALECAKRLEARQHEDDDFLERVEKERAAPRPMTKWRSSNGKSRKSRPRTSRR